MLKAVFLMLSLHFIKICASMDSYEADGKYPCGSVLNKSDGILRYKPFQTANQYERCVWILKVPDASSYNIKLYSLDYAGTFHENALLIVGLNRKKQLTGKVIPERAEYNYIIDGNVAMLTYYSEKDRPGRGFSLIWSVHKRSQMSEMISPNSAAIVASAGSVYSFFYRPSDTGASKQYDNNEISTFIFSPNFSNDKVAYRNDIKFTQKGLEGNTCNDYIDVFTFNPTFTKEGWSIFGKLCGPDKDELITTSEMTMLVFHSNGNGTNAGFELKCSRERNK